MPIPQYPVLARDVVRHVGDAIAFIVAETEVQGRDAADAFPVEWEPMAAAVGIGNAEKANAPLVWPDYKSNVAFDTRIGDKAKTDRAFEKAEKRITFTLVNNRLVTNYMEPRACLAEYDEKSQRWTLTVGSQGATTSAT